MFYPNYYNNIAPQLYYYSYFNQNNLFQNNQDIFNPLPTYFNPIVSKLVNSQPVSETSSTLNKNKDALNENVESKKKIKRKIKKVDQEYKVKKQNMKRNLFSNIAHHYINFLRRREQSEKIIKKIIQLHNLSITLDCFYSIVNRLKFNNYIRLEIVNKFWKGQFQNKHTDKHNDLGKIFRIAAFYFMNNECFCSIQYSKKINKDLKMCHFVKRRDIVKFLNTSINK